MRSPKVLLICTLLFSTGKPYASEYEVAFSFPSEKVISTNAIVESIHALGEDDSDSVSTDAVIEMLDEITLNKDLKFKIFEFSNSGLNDNSLKELAPKLSLKLADIEGSHILDFTYNTLTSESATALYNLLNIEKVDYIDICKNPRASLKYIKKLGEQLDVLAKKDGKEISTLTRKLIFIPPKYLTSAKTKLKVYRTLEGTLLPADWDERHKEYFRIKKEYVPTKELSLVEYDDPNLDDPELN